MSQSWVRLHCQHTRHKYTELNFCHTPRYRKAIYESWLSGNEIKVTLLNWIGINPQCILIIPFRAAFLNGINQLLLQTYVSFPFPAFFFSLSFHFYIGGTSFPSVLYSYRFPAARPDCVCQSVYLWYNISLQKENQSPSLPFIVHWWILTTHEQQTPFFSAFLKVPTAKVYRRHVGSNQCKETINEKMFTCCHVRSPSTYSIRWKRSSTSDQWKLSLLGSHDEEFMKHSLPAPCPAHLFRFCHILNKVTLAFYVWWQLLKPHCVREGLAPHWVMPKRSLNLRKRSVW